MKYRITLAYDGTEYAGWQMQLGRPTVQGVLSEVLERLEGARVVTHGAGRTDSGVHAEGQIASFRLTRVWEGRGLRIALNANLPPDIRVLEAAPAVADFHARYDAKGKTYRYQVYLGEVMSPFWERYAWHYGYSLNLDRLLEDGQQLIGTHDFTAFTDASVEVKTRVRTLREFHFTVEGAVLKLWFSGNGFLRYQVRKMVGALLAVNRGRLAASSIRQLLESRNRQLAAAPAPSKGLTLVKVEY